MKPSLAQQCVAEFIGIVALIFIGVGAIHHFGKFPGGRVGQQALMDGTPKLGQDVTLGHGTLIEAVLIFSLVFIVFGTAVDSRGPKTSGLVGLVYGRFLIKQP